MALNAALASSSVGAWPNLAEPETIRQRH